MDNELPSLQMHSIIRLAAANYHLHFSVILLSKTVLMESSNYPLKPRKDIYFFIESVRPKLLNTGLSLTLWVSEGKGRMTVPLSGNRP